VKDARVEAPPFAVSARTASRAGDFVALVKPRLNVLVVASSAAGFYLGAPTPLDVGAMALAVVGTALVAGGAAALNQVYERDTDALMRRTRLRPLPDGRITPKDGILFGASLSFAGLLLLATRANLSAAMLAFATLVLYLSVYTPMKRKSPIATLVGAVPGALPPLIGWAASHGHVSTGGLSLFAIVFVWQIPHFMAIAWLYREDYRKAGFPMLPVIDPRGGRAARQALIYALVLVPLSTAPAFVGVAGKPYLVIALLLSGVLAWLAARFASARNDDAARGLFLGSITYLPLLWMAMIVDRI
jgi:protoheme IX farnesyltransferase